MIELRKGNLLEAEAEALVNTVNTAGIMGKGIALQFRKRFPAMHEAYRKACAAGEVQPGRMHVYERREMFGPRYLINFPTKRHWKERARIEDIEGGLKSLAEEIQSRGIQSIAIPALGCGLGGLSWADVFPRIRKALERIPDVLALVYQPASRELTELARVRLKEHSRS